MEPKTTTSRSALATKPHVMAATRDGMSKPGTIEVCYIWIFEIQGMILTGWLYE